MQEESPLKVPGFGLPVDHALAWGKYFPNAVEDWLAVSLTLRELNMLQLMNQITDKPDWHRKVFNAELIEKWGQEATDAENMDFTDNMLDYVSTQSLTLRTFEHGALLESCIWNGEYCTCSCFSIGSLPHFVLQYQEHLLFCVVLLCLYPALGHNYHSSATNVPLDSKVHALALGCRWDASSSLAFEGTADVPRLILVPPHI